LAASGRPKIDFLEYKSFGSARSLNKLIFFFRSRGKDSEYENMDSDIQTEDDEVQGKPRIVFKSQDERDSEQREIDEFEEEERRILALDAQV